VVISTNNPIIVIIMQLHHRQDTQTVFDIGTVFPSVIVPKISDLHK